MEILRRYGTFIIKVYTMPEEVSGLQHAGSGDLQAGVLTGNNWFSKLAQADLGEPTAIYNLAILYKEGRGVSKSYAGFWNWLDRSAQKDDEPAKNMKQELLNAK